MVLVYYYQVLQDTAKKLGFVCYSGISYIITTGNAKKKIPEYSVIAIEKVQI